MFCVTLSTWTATRYYYPKMRYSFVSTLMGKKLQELKLLAQLKC
jgi:hypothetical protein